MVGVIMNKFEAFRKRYKTFYYHGFTKEDAIDYLLVTYHFEIEDLATFNPTLKIPKGKNVNYDDNVLNQIIFSAGLSEIPSYWKATCSPKIVISCGKLNDEQTRWVKKLLFNGLGEFFYVNDIKPNFDDFVDVVSDGPVYDVVDKKDDYHGYLVAVGGGKDSIVSLELLKDEKDKKVIIINNRKVCFDSAKLAGVSDADIIKVERLFDKKIIDLNKEGFLNGHTPLSSCIAFISYLTAYVHGIKYVVLSNEASANEASVKGTKINHQYSKSFEFESDFRYYTKKYLTDKIDYFSLLRPLSELQIMKIFSHHPKYFKHFISCNNGGKRKNLGITDGWCLTCPKCLFIYLLMSNFVNEDTMVEVFGKNLLDDETMLTYFKELIGQTDNKPFECVGTIDEVLFVVNNMIKKGGKLPYLINYYKENHEVMEPNYEMLTQINDANAVPRQLLKKVKEALTND